MLNLLQYIQRLRGGARGLTTTLSLSFPLSKNLIITDSVVVRNGDTMAAALL